MQKQYFIAAAAALCLMATAPVLAQEPRQISAEQAEKLQALQNMTPEERQAFIAAKREEMKNLSPEEREAAKAARKEQFQNMSDEDKQALKERFKERKSGENRRTKRSAP